MQLTVSMVISPGSGRSGRDKSSSSSGGELRLEVADNGVVVSSTVHVTRSSDHSATQVYSSALWREHHLLRLSFLTFNLRVRLGLIYKIVDKFRYFELWITSYKFVSLNISSVNRIVDIPVCCL